MFGNSKNVFWEALLIAGVVFALGLFLGVLVESGRLGQINTYYSQAQISLIDSMALSNTIAPGADCTNLVSSNVQFADNVYNEALILENYESSGKITNDMILAHREYDLLRTMLWQNLIKVQAMCPHQFNYIIYLYDYNPSDLTQKAEENVWSNILSEVKQQNGNNVILVPIAADSNLSSLHYMMTEHNITSLPAVIINGNETIYHLESVADIQKYIS